MRWAFVNTDFIEEEKATLQTGDLALQRGYAAFDFFRVTGNKPLFLEDYIDRFFNSANQMFIPFTFSKEDLKEIITKLLIKNTIPESGVRMIVTGGYSPDSYTPVAGNLVIQQQPIALPSPEKFMAGTKIMTYPYQRDLPNVKSINYLMGIWLQKQLTEKELEDVLYYREHIISEFPRANVFMVTQDKKLATPHRNILMGITRRQVLRIAAAHMQVEERDISIEELKDAAEVFMTSTTKRILPVTEIDNVKIGNGKAGAIANFLNSNFINSEKN